MSSDTSAKTTAQLGENGMRWVSRLPDGSVSVKLEGNQVVLHASRELQDRFEQLLEGRKAGTLTSDEIDQYDAICELDDKLSWLNRLARASERGI